MNVLNPALVAIADQFGPAPTAREVSRALAARKELARFLMQYRGAMDEMMTKINILKGEFELVHDYSPIEHLGSRLKSPRASWQRLRPVVWTVHSM
ncbi:hypothetical protein BH23ACT6_BH23ACT6_27590 [soil metagenome]